MHVIRALYNSFKLSSVCKIYTIPIHAFVGRSSETQVYMFQVYRYVLISIMVLEWIMANIYDNYVSLKCDIVFFSCFTVSIWIYKVQLQTIITLIFIVSATLKYNDNPPATRERHNSGSSIWPTRQT